MNVTIISLMQLKYWRVLIKSYIILIEMIGTVLKRCTSNGNELSGHGSLRIYLPGKFYTFDSVPDITGGYYFPLLNILFQIFSIQIHVFFHSQVNHLDLTMYEIRKNSPFYLQLKVFKWFWFFDLDPKKGNWMTSMGKLLLLLTFFISHGIFLTLHLFKIALVYQNISNSEDIAISIGSFGFCFVCYKTMYNYRHFNKVFRDLTDTARFEKPVTFDAEAKKCKLISAFFLGYMIVGITIYAILSTYETDECMVYQVQTTDDLYCSAVYPIWLPFKMNKSLLFVIQVLIAQEIYTPSGQTCSMLYEEVCLLESHIQSFSFQLRNVFRESEMKKRSRMLGYCAAYHSHIINLALEVNGLHRNITGHLAVVWAISVGCIANQLLNLYKPVGATIHLVAYLMSLSCLVISGQTLQTESETIADKLYCTPWYLWTIKEQKVVMFMIMRAQIPLTLTAKPFGNYEYALFVTIVKTAYSYLTLLQSTM